MKNDSRISLVVEGYPRIGYQTYAKIVGSSTSGLCISRLHPDYVAEKYHLDRSKRYWLSNQKGEEVISPKSIKKLVKTIRSELRGRGGGCVFLDGLEYILMYNDMGKVLGVLEEIDKVLRSADVEMIVPVDPLTFEQKDVERLWASFPRYTQEEILAKHITGQSQNIDTDTLVTAGPEIAGLKV
jgi:hypothetical protein